MRVQKNGELKYDTDLLIDQIRAKAVGQEVMTALSPGEQVIKILRDELVAILGKDTARVKFARPATLSSR